ncbi:unnamed protein product [Orchesella dallaii]|uniref:Uncharacterized protein n=1 Tax=Orchesella dallaii TaxID=48710 RepID=A0ABP1RQN1_9HEXA
MSGMTTAEAARSELVTCQISQKTQFGGAAQHQPAVTPARARSPVPAEEDHPQMQLDEFVRINIPIPPPNTTSRAGLNPFLSTFEENLKMEEFSIHLHVVELDAPSSNIDFDVL